MSNSRTVRTVLIVVMVFLTGAGAATLWRFSDSSHRMHLAAYFDNSNGIFAGDEVRILGVPVGKIETIEPQPQQVRISFWVDDKYKIPATAKAVILSPSLVTSRAIQLTPAYTGGPQMSSNTIIPLGRTAVPVEWDDLRQQLEKLTDALQPTQPNGVSTLGAFVSTAADNLRGRGESIRDSIIKLSQAFSILGDHSDDIFSSLRNLSVLTSALHSSADLMGQLNTNLASATALLADDPQKVGQATVDLNRAINDVTAFVKENRDSIGTTSDKLASVSQMLVNSLDDIKQTLHITPNTLQNFTNIYDPAQGSFTGILVASNFSNTIQFICGAIQAASRLNADQSAKLCVQYLAPIVKNRQFNFPPWGENLFVGATARPNEITYSEDWLRPDHVPASPGPPPADGSPPPGAPLAAEAGPPPTPDPGGPTNPAVQTDPAGGLLGMMMPGQGGS